MNVQITTPQQQKRQPVPMNGVDTPTLLATINAVGAQPELAQFRFRAENKWIAGTHSRSTMSGFFGAGAEQQHKSAYAGGWRSSGRALRCRRSAPAPVEWVLHALATCLTAGIGNIASARGIRLTRVESTVEGQIDLRGILGLSKEVRNGFKSVEVSFDIEGDASDEDLEKIVMQAKARSAVFDIITNGVPVAIKVN